MKVIILVLSVSILLANTVVDVSLLFTVYVLDFLVLDVLLLLTILQIGGFSMGIATLSFDDVVWIRLVVSSPLVFCCRSLVVVRLLLVLICGRRFIMFVF